MLKLACFQIRLFLSSRTEMNTVIGQLKAGALGSANANNSPSKNEAQGSLNSVAQVISQPWGGNNAPHPIHSKSAQNDDDFNKHASGRPPFDDDYGKPVYATRPQPQIVNGPVITSDIFRKAHQLNQAEQQKEAGSFQNAFSSRPPILNDLPFAQGNEQQQQQQPTQTPMRFFNAPANSNAGKAPNPPVSNANLSMGGMKNGPQMFRPDNAQQSTSVSTSEAKKVLLPEEILNNLPPHLRPPFGIPPANIRQFFPGSIPPASAAQPTPPVSLSSSASSGMPRSINNLNVDAIHLNPLTNETARLLPSALQGPPPVVLSSNVSVNAATIKEESWRDSSNYTKKTSSSTDLLNQPPAKKPALAMPPGPPLPMIMSNLNKKPGDLPNPNQRPVTSMLGKNAPFPPMGLPPNLPGPPLGNLPLPGLPPPSLGIGALPPVPSLSNQPTVKVPRQPMYIELSRLPLEMLQSHVLEAFIRPSIPLALNAAKVIYSPEGIHMHTLIRFSNPDDGLSMLNRDNELGIKIRPTTKAIFEAAVDGLPKADDRRNRDNDRGDGRRRNDRDRDRERERGRDREGDRRRRSRTRSPAGRRRGRDRSRSPRRSRREGRRSRSRSPAGRGKNDAPNRWCVCMTNVPHKAKEDDVRKWFQDDNQPKLVRRAYNADGNASDKWVAEFETEGQMDKAFDIKENLMGRTIRMRVISNQLADEYLAVQDIYGVTKRLNDPNPPDPRLVKPIPPHLPPVTHFGVPVPSTIPISKGRGLLPAGPSMGRGQMMSGLPPGMPLIVPPEYAMRGGIHGRGRGRGGHFMQGGNTSWRAKVGNENGSKLNGGPDAELIAQIGNPGTVIMCENFPPNICLEDVLAFFEGFPVDPNSIRIRMGDNNVPTGECILSIAKPELAREAIAKLSHSQLRGHKVNLRLS
ncbi:hypothetical protein WR25_14608 [Diploscapter pachys]|uniref:RRM domain-containing protein n=1 Tax=Diploscapter pachys TaxID=2018661 RepID=A0A2A2LWB6_9BILA|nr:hypothetical protein WR25_14608 [Diploscapter pachys]